MPEIVTFPVVPFRYTRVRSQSESTMRWGLRFRLLRSIVCENSRLSPFLTSRDVSLGGTSARQRNQLHTDEVKFIWNLVRSSDCSTYQFSCFCYCLRTTDNRQTVTKVKRKRDESGTKQSIFVEHILLQEKHLSFVGASSPENTKLYHNRSGEI